MAWESLKDLKQGQVLRVRGALETGPGPGPQVEVILLKFEKKETL